MAVFVPIPLYLQIAQISQYLSQASAANDEIFKGGPINNNYTRLLRAVRLAVQWAYNRNPDDLSVEPIAIYMYQLCGRYTVRAQNIINDLAGELPVITGPASQSVNVGDTATFSVSVDSPTNVTYQWFDYLGNPIVGATSPSYNFTNSQLTDTGKTFFVKATNLAGQVVSGTATLTVTAALVALTSYTDIDPGPDLQANIDNFTYQITTSIVHDASISIIVPLAATPNKYFVTKVAIAESVKSVWFNTALNNGNIPDAVYQNIIQFGGFTYYYTRVAASMDSTQPLILSS